MRIFTSLVGLALGVTLAACSPEATESSRSQSEGLQAEPLQAEALQRAPSANLATTGDSVAVSGRTAELAADTGTCTVILSKPRYGEHPQTLDLGLQPPCAFLRHGGDEWVEAGTPAVFPQGMAEGILVLGALEGESSCTSEVRTLLVSATQASVTTTAASGQHCQGEVWDDKDYWMLANPFNWDVGMTPPDECSEADTPGGCP